MSRTQITTQSLKDASVTPIKLVSPFTFTGNVSAANLGTSSSINYTSSDTAPLTPSANDKWLDTTSLKEYTYYDGFWVETAGAAVTHDSVQTALSSGDYVFGGKVSSTGQGVLSSLQSNDLLTKSLGNYMLLDPSIVYMRDDFLGGVVATSGSVSELGWYTYFSGGGTGGAIGATTDNFPNVGTRTITCGNATNAGGTLYLSQFNNLQTNTNWEVCFIAKINALTDCDAIFGFTQSANIGIGQFGGQSFGIRYSSSVDTDFMFYSKNTTTTWVANDANNYSLSTGVAADTNFHTFRIRSTSVGVIEMKVDNGAWTVVSMVTTFTRYVPMFYISTLTTASKIITVDYFSFLMQTTR